LFEIAFELHRDVEVILDGVLPAPSHDDDVVDTRLNGLLDAVLNDRLVHQDEHFFRLRLGGGEKSSAEPGGREDGLADCAGHGAILSQER